jgi:hypothetical protein
MTENVDVFAAWDAKAWSVRYSGRLHFVSPVHGGTPTNSKVATSWLKTKFQDSDEGIQARVAEVMLERQIDAEEAIKVVGDLKLLKGFKLDEHGLYLEGRTQKANLKEAASVAVAAGKITQKGWGVASTAGKFLTRYLPEHLFIEEQKLYLLTDDDKYITEPTGIEQRFVTTYNGTGITYEEFVVGANIDFTVVTDYDFDSKDKDFWPMLWKTAGKQGLGATRSMGYGEFIVTRWDRVR